MTYQVTISRQARRALTVDLPEPVAAACFAFIEGPLADDPYPVGKPLHEPLEGLFSARRGDFRVIYAVHEQAITVHVVTIRHRRDAYRS